MMMANGAYQSDSTGKRIKVGRDAPEQKGERLSILQRSQPTR